MVANFEYIYWTNKTLQAQKKIWQILRLMLINKDYFKKTWINDISKNFKICKKTLKKYLKSNFLKIKWWNDKRIYFRDKTEYLFFKDLEKLINKYNNLLDNQTIRKGQYYLNNLNIK